MSLADNYKQLIASEHRDKPKYMATVAALLAHSDDIFRLGVYLDDEFDLELAEGKQEDIIGENVGIGRHLPFQPQKTSSILDDENYRTLIKSQIVKNTWQGGIDDLKKDWQRIFGREIHIKDNQDMTIDVYLESMNALVDEMVQHRMIVPKPQSVGINMRHLERIAVTLGMGTIVSISRKYTLRPSRVHDEMIPIRLHMGVQSSTTRKYYLKPRMAMNSRIAVRIPLGSTTTVKKEVKIK